MLSSFIYRKSDYFLNLVRGILEKINKVKVRFFRIKSVIKYKFLVNLIKRIIEDINNIMN